MTLNRTCLMLLATLAMGMAVSCRPQGKNPPPALPATQPVKLSVRPVAATQPFEAIELKHVHNVHRVTDTVISGSQPEGEEGLRELADLGVKTIISVDGMTPDADGARRLGMRYVHLPISYDTVPADRGRQIARAIRELPGPVYIHCHHGKHRSAAAVAVACVNSGALDPSRAEEVLRTFGTGKNYKGLWQSARDSRPIDDATLAAVPVEYQEKAKITGMAHAMIKVDDHTEHLKSIQKAGWTAPADHPDLDPPHEALLLEEALTESGRTSDAQKEPAEFHKLLQANIAASAKLRENLAAKPIDPKAADAGMKAVTQSCTACHAVFRD